MKRFVYIARRDTATRRHWARRGRGLVWLALSLPALLGLVGLTVDGGRLYLARQRVVNICDAAVYSAARQLLGEDTELSAVRADVLAAVSSNVGSADSAWAVAVSDADLAANPDIIVAQLNDTPATNSALTEAVEWRRDNGDPIAPGNPPTYAPLPGNGLMVRGRIETGASFMAVLGFDTTTIGAVSILITDCPSRVSGTKHLSPIWISGNFQPGQQVTLTLDNGSGNVPPGSYGFINPTSFEPYTMNSSVFDSWLQFGPDAEAGLSVYSGGPLQVGTPGVITAYTGWSWGQVVHAIMDDTGAEANADPATYGARIERQVALFPEDTPTGAEAPCGVPPGSDPANPAIDPADPRIVIVPIVTFRFGTGSNALFTVDAFGAFWINCLGNSSDKSVIANFINFVAPGSGGGPCAGVRVFALVR